MYDAKEVVDDGEVITAHGTRALPIGVTLAIVGMFGLSAAYIFAGLWLRVAFLGLVLVGVLLAVITSWRGLRLDAKGVVLPSRLRRIPWSQITAVSGPERAGERGVILATSERRHRTGLLDRYLPSVERLHQRYAGDGDEVVRGDEVTP